MTARALTLRRAKDICMQNQASGACEQGRCRITAFCGFCLDTLFQTPEDFHSDALNVQVGTRKYGDLPLRELKETCAGHSWCHAREECPVNGCCFWREMEWVSMPRSMDETMLEEEHT